jgi:hypothetical protein
MSITEIRKNVEKTEIMTTIYLVPGIALMALVIAYKKLIFPYLENICKSLYLPNLFYAIAVFSVALVIPLICIFLGVKAAKRRYGTSCTSCGVLIDKKNIDIIIATKNCASCGENIID